MRNRKDWADALNALFTKYTPDIRLHAVRVVLQGTSTPQIIKHPNNWLNIYPADTVILPGLARVQLFTRPTPIPVSFAVVDNESDTDTKHNASDDTPSPSSDIQTVATVSPSVSQPTIDSQLETQQAQVITQAELLRRALLAYGIAVAGIDVERTQVGPRVIRYWVKLQPPAGRLSEVQKYAVDLARELGSKNIPLIDNIPGEKYIGIDLARDEPEIIPITPALDRLPLDQPTNLMVAMGVDTAGKPFDADLVRLPHLLVAGSTGSGKTMFLASLIMSLVWRHTASELELVLIDPKQTDFVVFEELPHLRDKRIFYDPSESIATLQVITSVELERRTRLLREAGCPNNLEYNRRNPTQRLPWIVIVIDEFADIMMTLPRARRDEFERLISRLAAIGRSKGIHLILATQRPTTDIITGTLKANIPGRISFRLPSGIDSRTILDRTGAENLLGYGDMLALIDGSFQRLQGYYTPFDEIMRLLALRTP